MTLEELQALFEKYDDEFLKFEKVTNKRSSRPDIHVFILLNEFAPKDYDMISAAEHDEIWLDVKPEDIVPQITEEQVIELIRCGIRYDGNYECFAMFV